MYPLFDSDSWKGFDPKFEFRRVEILKSPKGMGSEKWNPTRNRDINLRDNPKTSTGNFNLLRPILRYSHSNVISIGNEEKKG